MNHGDSINDETWETILECSGMINASVTTEISLPNNNNPKATTDQPSANSIALIRFPKILNLKADLSYAVRVHLNGGKTFYGEEGVCSLRLQNNICLSFAPCSLSQNGTTIQRGQIPYFLYSIEDRKPTENINLNGKEINVKSKFSTELFNQIMRLLAQKLSATKCMNFQLQNEALANVERKIASQLVGYANGNFFY